MLSSECNDIFVAKIKASLEKTADRRSRCDGDLYSLSVPTRNGCDLHTAASKNVGSASVCRQYQPNLATSQSSLISLLNAETGVRGYYIAKEPIFLEPYNLALATLKPELIRLAQLVQDNPAQSRRVQLLTQIAQSRLDLLAETVRRVAAGTVVSPEIMTERLLNGKREMDRFRVVIREFETEEYRRLGIHTRSLQDQQQFNADAMWLGIVIGLLGTAVAVRLLRQLATELRDREIRLRESRSLIEAIVADRKSTRLNSSHVLRSRMPSSA